MSDRGDNTVSRLAIAAIDFGTTYSGYAVSFAGDDAVFVNKDWGNIGGFGSMKTPTCVLTDFKDGEHTFLNFGFEAENNYLTRLLGENKQSTCLFNRFKMKLHQPNLSDETAETSNEPLDFIVDKRGRQSHKVDSITIFAMALSYIKNHMKDFVNNLKHGIDINIDDSSIQWVVTVPAIWSITAKSFMRKAAFKAGLINEEDSSQLILALEPEAASLHCKSLKMNSFLDEHFPGDLHMPAGTVYAIVDAGGGTVDITVHKVLPGKGVEEVCAASGGPWGGTNIDKAFVELLKRVWNDTFIEKLQEDFASLWWEIVSRFEIVKRTADPDKDEDMLLLLIETKMAQIYNKTSNTDISVTNPNVKDVSVNDDFQLVAKKCVVDSLMMPTVDLIVNKIQQVEDILQKEKNEKTKYIFLVGGLSCCKYLTAAIRKKYRNKIKVLIPQNPEMAIMSGAVKFGQDPDHIKKRTMDLTYGVKTYTAFTSDHPESRKEIIEGKEKCSIFDKFATVDESVPIDQEVTKTYYPVRSNQKSVKFTFYETSRSDVKYTDEKEVFETRTYLEVQMPDTSNGLDRPVEFKVKCGRTEIEARAREKDKESAEWKKAFLKYGENNRVVK